MSYSGVVLESSLALAAIGLAIVRSWPQVFRIVNRRTTTGVSSLTWVMILLTHIVWAYYGLVLDVFATIVANTLAAVGCTAVLATLAYRKQLNATVALVVIPATVACCVLTFDLGGREMVRNIAVLLGVSMFIPQLVKVVRTSTEGVSLTTWTLILMNGLVWVAYAFVVDELSIAAPYIFTLPCILAILWKASTAQRATRIEQLTQS